MNKTLLAVIAANFILITAVAAIWVVPTAVSAYRTNRNIALQQRQYTALARLDADYQYLLHEIETLSHQQQLLTHDEVMQTLVDISHLAAQNNLHEISFNVGEAMGFDSRVLERAKEINLRVENAGFENDILQFLYEIENTPAIITSGAIVWDGGSQARINLQLSLFFY